MKKPIGFLDLNRPHRMSATKSGVRLNNTSPIKEKLLGDLVELQKQMESLEATAGGVDFSMLQTYKEMIQSRKSLFNELNR